MPITKQATKKMRHDKTVTEKNAKQKQEIKRAVKTARKTPTKKSLDNAFSVIDKAAKKHYIHKNKASRLKSRLSKLQKNSKK
jgi:small subunit ribosomal protein S20